MTLTAMSYDEFINLSVLATDKHDRATVVTGQGRSADVWKQHHDLLTQRELT